MRYAFFGHSPDFGDFEARIVGLTGLSNSKSHQCEQKANSGFLQPRARGRITPAGFLHPRANNVSA
jgi:hypothetical protein